MARPVFQVVDGILVPPQITQERVDELKRTLILREGDVIISTYPKAGTAWAQTIVKLLRNGGVEDGRQVDEAIPWPEFNHQVDVKAMPHPRAFKSHMALSPDHWRPASHHPSQIHLCG